MSDVDQALEILKRGAVEILVEGELRESYFLLGQWHNDRLFGLLKKEFPFS